MNAAEMSQRMWNTRYGVMNAIAADNLTTRSLSLLGEWMEQELDLLSTFVEEGQTVVEFGADYGAHTLWLSRAVGAQGEVHTAEPRRLEFQQLCANLAINGLTNVHTLPVWLGRHSSQAQLVDLLPNIGTATNERVRVTNIDSLGLEALHLLKVNQPGTLEGVLSGADESVRKHRPVIYLRLGTVEQSIAEVKVIKELGYRCWSHLPYLFNKDNYGDQTDNIFPGRVFQNVIAAPIEGRLSFDHLQEI
ncbi:methyltransferase, FkbM family [Dyella jiangningensis]|uniref:FkbM family methyltransferase n=1 Tax=Dyella sp. AtDHG13 TaxID=1938897 RepID=UPI0008866E14|nr:FkbM family methyltransferase [Dyella sp. AtDHG13]PXV58255.1 FkbM family methyltransferase [Dyella sp. AtDHG13]SDK10041.1 methyltransferase, FkbM family [Dyella jiangningensis]